MRRLEGEEEALAYYAKWRMPAMTRLPGSVRTRTLASVAGWAKHAILYEFVSLQARNHFEEVHEDGDENRAWTDKVFSHFTRAPGSSNVARRLWPPVEEGIRAVMKRIGIASLCIFSAVGFGDAGQVGRRPDKRCALILPIAAGGGLDIVCAGLPNGCRRSSSSLWSWTIAPAAAEPLA